MEYHNQIKNIGSERHQLMYKKFTLEKQLLKVKSEIESLDKKATELFEANQEEPGVKEQEIDDEYDDRYDEDCFLRKRKIKKIGKGFTRRHSLRNKFDSAGESKKRDKESRAAKKRERVICDKFKSQDVEDGRIKEEIRAMRYEMREQIEQNILYADMVEKELRIPTILQNFKSRKVCYSSDDDDDDDTEYIRQVEEEQALQDKKMKEEKELQKMISKLLGRRQDQEELNYIREMEEQKIEEQKIEEQKIDEQRLIRKYISSMGAEFIHDLRDDWNTIDHCLCGSCWDDYLLERAIDKKDRVFDNECYYCGYGGYSCH
jgi:hypothetical protein